MIKTHTISGGSHSHSGIVGTDTGNRGGTYSNVPIGAQEISGGSHTHTYGNATDNPETRPINYTVRVWKRTA
jgi:hypothetical protein